jgi:hypothetical protein
VHGGQPDWSTLGLPTSFGTCTSSGDDGSMGAPDMMIHEVGQIDAGASEEQRAVIALKSTLQQVRQQQVCLSNNRCVCISTICRIHPPRLPLRQP